MITRPLNIHARGTIQRIREQRFTLSKALLELIDNAIDAKATKVVVSSMDDDLLISDNGEGFDDVARGFDIGDSEKLNQIGRYGVGLKDASIRYSDETIICSKGKYASCDWVDALKTGEPTIFIGDTDDQQTKIIWRNFHERYTRPIDTTEIRRCYAVRLQDGMEIHIQGTQIDPLPMPEFSEKIEHEFDYEGKRVRLAGGIFPHNDPLRKEWNGYNIYYRGRLIGLGREKTKGTGDTSCSNFSFMVHLIDGDDDKWKLATNKDDVDGVDSLLDYVFHRYTRPLLKKAEEEATDIELRELVKAIESGVNGNGTINRGERKNKGTRGPVKKKGPPKENTFSGDGSPGPYKARNNGRLANGKLKLNFVGLGDTIGEISIQKTTIVNLNEDHPFIAEHKRNLEVMKGVAIMAYSMSVAYTRRSALAEDDVNEALRIAGDHLNTELDTKEAATA